jgi:hypothetical protein
MFLGRTDGEENAPAYLNFLRTSRSCWVHVATRGNFAVSPFSGSEQIWPVLNNLAGFEQSG